MRFPWIFLSVLLIAGPALAATELTIYSPAGMQDSGGQGYAWVKESRTLKLSAGRQKLTLEDLPTSADASSVQLVAEAAAFQVISQQFRFDLVSQDALLKHFLGREIMVERIAGDKILREEGTLLQASPLTLQKADGSVLSLMQYDALQFPKLREGLALKPALLAEIDAKKSGTAPADIYYQTGGMGWWVDYTLYLNNAANVGNFGANLHITNHSGKSFSDAALSVMAGNIPQQPQQENYARAPRPMMAKAMSADMAGGGVSESVAGDAHRYQVQGKVSLPDNSTTQLLFQPAAEMPVSKIYRYQGTQNYGYGGTYLERGFGLMPRQEIAVALKFKNTKSALPAGTMRVFDEGGVFLGQSGLSRVSENEESEISLGTAFDITAERAQEDFARDDARKQIDETIRITLKNRSKKEVTVEVMENLYRSEKAQVLEKSHDFTKLDANTLKFPVKIGAGKEAVLRYKVRYNW